MVNNNNHNKNKEHKLTEYHQRRTVASSKKKELERLSEPRNSFKKEDSKRKDLKEIELPNDSNVIKGNIQRQKSLIGFMKYVLLILPFVYEHVVIVQHRGKAAADRTTAHIVRGFINKLLNDPNLKYVLATIRNEKI